MRKILNLTIGISLGLISNLIAIEYEDLYANGNVTELREEIYAKPQFESNELPRAAFYESLITSKNFDLTLQELIEGFPEIEYKDQVNFKLGVINFFQRKYSQAEFYLSKIDNIDTFNEYNYWLARLYYMKQEQKQSSEYANIFLKNCEKMDHKYELSFYMLIENSVSQMNFQKAVVLAEELLMKKPEGINKAYLYNRIGYSYERLDNVHLAVENYKKSFEENPYGQYATLTEERLFEIKKNVDRNIDISFLYTKNYDSDVKNKPIAYKTSPKNFNVTELVSSDTTSVLSKYFDNQYIEEDTEHLPTTIDTENIESNSRHGNNDHVYVSKNETDTNDHDIVIPINPGGLPSRTIVNERENRIIESDIIQMSDNTDNGVLLERPKNIETDGYVYLENKPVGKYYIQIARFSNLEFAVNRTKELFYLQQRWNIFKDLRGGNVTYVIWSKDYDSAAKAKEDIALFKSKNIDCFLVSND